MTKRTRDSRATPQAAPPKAGTTSALPSMSGAAVGVDHDQPYGGPAAVSGRLDALEAAIVAVLTNMGPLAFGSLARMVGERRQLVGYALNRLQAQGTVAIHGHRIVGHEFGASQPFPVYCARRSQPSSGTEARPSGGDAGQSTDLAHDDMICPTCGWARFEVIQHHDHEENDERQKEET